MTCVIHHGPPGSFKSFGTIQRVAIPDLKGKEIQDDKGNVSTVGRVVVSNVRGFNSLELIEEALGFSLHPDSSLIYVDADSEKGFQAMRLFHHWAPKGALLIIDEVQRVFSKKRHRDLSKLDLKLTDKDGDNRDYDELIAAYPLWDGDYDRPETIEDALDQHRHYNWDIYCTTPNISKVHPEIREVVEIAYRHKPLGTLLPQWRNKWKEFAHDAEQSGKSVSHYSGVPRTYEADLKIFGCYQSTKTGKVKGSSEVRPLYRDPKIQAVLGGVFLSICAFIYIGIDFYQTSPLLKGFRLVESGEVEVLDIESSNDVAGDVNSGVSDSSGLESVFDKLASLDSPALPSEPVRAYFSYLGSYSAKGFDIRLGAILRRSNGDLVYRLLVTQGLEIVDTLTQADVIGQGFSQRYSSGTLYLDSDNESFIVRPLAYFSGSELGGSYSKAERPLLTTPAASSGIND